MRKLKTSLVGTSSTVMAHAREMEKLVQLLELGSGGVTEIQGLLLSCFTELIIQFEVRNIAERCPGDQTNNRAELIVCFWICFWYWVSDIDVNTGNSPGARNHPSVEETFIDQN